MLNLAQLRDGSIRCYGRRLLPDGKSWSKVYLESRDHGLSWTEHESREPAGVPLDRFLALEVSPAFVQSPHSGDVLFLVRVREPDGTGHVEAWRSGNGIEGDWTSRVVCREKTLEVRLPVFLKSRKRVLAVANVFKNDRSEPVFSSEFARPLVLLSDDDGQTWRSRMLEGVGPFPVSWPNKGMRWSNGAKEPTVVELRDGRLYMIIRTSSDNLYETWSDDGGETWTPLRPSIFHGTCTMPTLHALPDGRIILFWCNTTPFPEWPKMFTDDEARIENNRKGRVLAFTNRDVFHAAISEDDGKTWKGFRELLLNPERNSPDFALSQGGEKLSQDKSVHQAQALNLPFGKVLVAVGQHPACRRLLVFDPDWLCQTDRSDDFQRGLDDWSVHQFVRGIEGHLALNRRPGATLVEHPAEPGRRVLRVRRVKDESLVSDVQGALWNFPAAFNGAFSTRIQLLPGCRGGSISLLDRWFNPTDVTARARAMFDLYFDGRGSGYIPFQMGCWHQLDFVWRDLERSPCVLLLDGVRVGELPLLRPSPCGISYVLFQSCADDYDESGFLVERVAAAGK